MGLRGPDKSERMQWDSAAEARDNGPCGFACLAVAVDALPWDVFATYHSSTVFVSFAISLPVLSGRRRKRSQSGWGAGSQGDMGPC